MEVLDNHIPVAGFVTKQIQNLILSIGVKLSTFRV
jgi:hypothetical protein